MNNDYNEYNQYLNIDSRLNATRSIFLIQYEEEDGSYGLLKLQKAARERRVIIKRRKESEQNKLNKFKLILQ